MTEKEWIFPSENIDEELVCEYAKTFEIPKIVARVLINRGFTDINETKKFLDKNSSSFYSAFLLRDMDKAVERINKAIENNEKVVVYGDYDVDGITSTALVVEFLRSCGVETDYYIPDRKDEGYGINKKAIDKIAKDGATLLISVDTGITAYEETKYAKALGIDVIITDHHECKDTLPEAIAVINPKRNDSEYPFKDLAGVGVAFKLVCAASGKSEGEILSQYADIVALGTIADVVSLKDENRIIAARGMEKIAENPNIGLSAVISTLSLKQKWNNCAVVSYSLAPRLNAAGRMSNAKSAVELLLTRDEEKAEELAVKLDEENKTRQQVEKKIFEQAVEMLNDYDISKKKVLVLAKRDWHHGIIGVVASRLCEKYNKTCILISIEDEWCKSSGRSAEGFNLYDALTECSDILEKFGGHAYAAGFSIKEEYIKELDRRLNDFAGKHETGEIIPKLMIDSLINIEDIDASVIQKTQVLAPYGAGNKAPIFALMDVTIADIRPLSEGKHARILVESYGKLFETIAFGGGSIVNEYRVGDTIDVAGELNINLYNGQTRLQMIVSGIRMSHFSVSSVLPDRRDFADIYRFLKSRENTKCEIPDLLRTLSKAIGRRIMREKLINVLRVFKDTEILDYYKLGNVLQIVMHETEKGKKVSIDKSVEYQKIKKEVELIYK